MGKTLTQGSYSGYYNGVVTVENIIEELTYQHWRSTENATRTRGTRDAPI